MFRIHVDEEKPEGKIKEGSPMCYQKNHENMQPEKRDEKTVSQEKR